MYDLRDSGKAVAIEIKYAIAMLRLRWEMASYDDMELLANASEVDMHYSPWKVGGWQVDVHYSAWKVGGWQVDVHYSAWKVSG
jgi:hypothetical protein